MEEGSARWVDEVGNPLVMTPGQGKGGERWKSPWELSPGGVTQNISKCPFVTPDFLPLNCLN